MILFLTQPAIRERNTPIWARNQASYSGGNKIRSTLHGTFILGIDQENRHFHSASLVCMGFSNKENINPVPVFFKVFSNFLEHGTITSASMI